MCAKSAIEAEPYTYYGQLHAGTQMRNPWIKKNPFMSMWLSGANAVAGSVRGRATAEAKRQATTAMTKGVKQMVNFWNAGLITSPPRKKAKHR